MTVELLELASGNHSGSSWGISSIFGSSDSAVSSSKESSTNKSHVEPVHGATDYAEKSGSSIIRLREVLRILSF